MRKVNHIMVAAPQPDNAATITRSTSTIKFFQLNFILSHFVCIANQIHIQDLATLYPCHGL